MKKKKSKGRQIPFQAAFLLLLAGLVLSGCAWREESAAAEKTTQIVLTTGFLPDEVFRLENTSCSRAELMVYLVTEQNGYEAVYGAALWESEQGKELEERLKNNVLAEISQVKAMILLAERKGIALTEEEKRLVSQAFIQFLLSPGNLFWVVEKINGGACHDLASIEQAFMGNAALALGDNLPGMSGSTGGPRGH